MDHGLLGSRGMLRASNVVLALALGGCVAPAATIGVVDGSSGEAPPGSSSSGGSSSTSSSSDSGGPLACEPACVAAFPCQDSLCEDGACRVSFFDERCEPGQTCGLAGCEAVPLRCDDPAVLLCEDFEGRAFSGAWDGGSVGRTQDPVHTGASAGWVDVAPDQRQQLEYRLEAPVDEGMLAVRAFVWLPAADTVQEWSILFEIFGSTEAGSERYSVDLRPQAGIMFVSLLTLEATVLGNDLLVPGAWACVEMRVDLSNDQGEVELRVDDVPVLSNGPGIDTVPVDGVRNIQIGGIGAPDHDGPTAYGIDDVVIARAPIGCVVD